MKSAQDKVVGVATSGQLGLFANGYWGHPAMRLSPEINLIAFAHYLQALEFQRKANQVVAILMSDDAIGPYCTQHLLANYEFPENVDVSDLGTPGLDLALHLSTADVVIAIDALRGIELLTGRRDTRLDTHAPALEESILIAHLAGDRPFDVRLVGLGGVSFEHGTTLSPATRARIAALSDRVLAELTDLGVAWRHREHRATPDVWWEKSAGARTVPARPGALGAR